MDKLAGNSDFFHAEQVGQTLYLVALLGRVWLPQRTHLESLPRILGEVIKFVLLMLSLIVWASIKMCIKNFKLVPPMHFYEL